MPRARRVVLLTALCALALAAPAGGQGADKLSDSQLYWLGPYFGGLELTDAVYQTFAYGECEFPEGEGGCTLPVQVENATTCSQNPIAEGAGPEHEVFLVRGGGLAVAYGEEGGGEVDLGTGRQTLSLRAHEPEVLGAMLREAHRRSETGPQPLVPPVYPLPVLRELVRVTAAEKRFDGVAAVAKATGLSPGDVEMRSRIAELLGPKVLAGVPAPTMTVATVEHLRQLAWGVQTHDLAHTAERHKMSIATLRKKIARVRGLAGDC
ncbi:MAG TPA: hypothetical protein VFX85_08815 [Solirubrobacterales bacterium]|nr:hypothetical protein [Solirubrobacterales bacterium]